MYVAWGPVVNYGIYQKARGNSRGSFVGWKRKCRWIVDSIFGMNQCQIAVWLLMERVFLVEEGTGKPPLLELRHSVIQPVDQGVPSSTTSKSPRGTAAAWSLVGVCCMFVCMVRRPPGDWLILTDVPTGEKTSPCAFQAATRLPQPRVVLPKGKSYQFLHQSTTSQGANFVELWRETYFTIVPWEEEARPGDASASIRFFGRWAG